MKVDAGVVHWGRIWNEKQTENKKEIEKKDQMKPVAKQSQKIAFMAKVWCDGDTTTGAPH